MSFSRPFLLAAVMLGPVALMAGHPPMGEETEGDATVASGTDHDGVVQTLESGVILPVEEDQGAQEVLEYPGEGAEVELDFGSESEIEEAAAETEEWVEPGQQD